MRREKCYLIKLLAELIDHISAERTLKEKNYSLKKFDYRLQSAKLCKYEKDLQAIKK